MENQQANSHAIKFVVIALAIALVLAIGYLLGMMNAASNSLPANDVATPQPSTTNTTTALSLKKETYKDELARNVTFDFPDTWNVYTKAEDKLTTISVSPLTFGECSECGGYYGNVAMEISIFQYPNNSTEPDLKSVENVVAYMAERGTNYEVTSSKSLTRGVLYTLTLGSSGYCDAPGCDLARGKNQWVFVPTSNNANMGQIVWIRSMFVAPSLKEKVLFDEVQAGQEMIIGSIDFPGM